MDPLRLARAALHVLAEAEAGDAPAQAALPARIRLLAETRLRATASGTVALHRLRDAPGAASTTMAEIVLADEADRDPAFAAALGALLEELRGVGDAGPARGAARAPGAAEAAPERDAESAAAAPAEAPAGVPGEAAPVAGATAPAPPQAATSPLLPPPPAAPQTAGSDGDGPERAGPAAVADPPAIPADPVQPAPPARSAGRAVRAAFLAGAAATTAIAATGGRVPAVLWPLLLLLAVAGLVCARSAVRRPFRPLLAAGLLLNLAVLALLAADAVTGRAF
ncbi:hypothetical protein ACIO7M_32295 [Streptomyces toxytricini]|uniref:Uncharacterized protein n=1 Tax=Streptomyces toxytricini TaxID=67369 RepID=A0ABW8ET32_STRT5